MTLGNRIKKARIQKGYTQDELAALVGYKSRSSINKIEKEGRDIPRSSIIKFAQVLGVTPSYLMGWEDEQKKNDTLSDVVVRMRTDDIFLSVVETLNQLDDDKLLSVQQMLTAFLK